MHRLLLFFMATLFLTATVAEGQIRSDGAAIADQITRVLKLQAEAWNRGDIAAFMEHYWKSDKLTFSSGGKTTRGWAQTKENYLKRYPTREQMGTLTFDELEFFPLGESAALVLGRWHLKRAADPLGGNFSLVFRRLDGRWLIVHDHTSRSEEK